MKQTMGVLACMAAPKQWPLRNGGTVDVETPATTRYHTRAFLCLLFADPGRSMSVFT
jgi:hypothetical protein